MDRCVSASNFLPPGVLGLPSRHAPHHHLAIAHNPLPSNNHLSQIHLRRPSLNYSRLHSLSSPTTDHLLIPEIIYEMTKCPHFPFSFPGTFPYPSSQCALSAAHLRYGRFSAANISYSRETSMQRLGTPGRGKTLKTSPPAPVAAGTVFRAKTPGFGASSSREAKFVHIHSGIFDPFPPIPDKNL